jgi:CRP-like cAMP-binding protein
MRTQQKKDRTMRATALRTHTAHVDHSAPGAAFCAHPDSGREIAALDRIGTVVSLRRDQALFHEGDPARDLFKVVTGAVRSCRLLTDGRRQISAFALPGDFIALELADTYGSTAEAVSDATVMRYSRHAVERVAQQQPRLGNYLLGLIYGELSAAQSQMMLLGRKSAAERLASFLLTMADRNGIADRVSLPMTRSDIADHLGLTTETVSRIFGQFKSEGVIRLDTCSEVVWKNRGVLEVLAEPA